MALVAFMQPLLVLALQLVVEDHLADARATLGEFLGLSQICPVDLAVVFHLARLFQLRVKGLVAQVAALVAALSGSITAMRFQQVASLFGEHHSNITPAIEPHRSDKCLFAQVTQISRTRIRGSAIVVAQVARRDDAKRAHSRKCAALRAAQRELTTADVVDNLSLGSTRQLEVAREKVARISTMISIAIVPVIARSWVIKHRTSDDTLALELSRSSNHPARNPDSRSGQNRDNLAKCRVIGGCPPTTNYPMKMGLVVSSGLKSFRKKRLLTGGLLVRVQPEEPTSTVMIPGPIPK